MIVLYEKPLKVVLKDSELIVDGTQHAKDVRRISQMKEVFRGFVGLDFSMDKDVYYMYRGVFQKEGVRFDITVIPPARIEGEFAKTYGHSHPIAEKDLSYPEIYQVLHGSAAFLLQQTNRDKAVDVKLIKSGKGDVLLIPPNFSHVTINPGNVPLVLANIVADGFESDYSDFKKNRGAAFYCMADGNVEQNANYVVKNLEKPEIKRFNSRYGFSCRDILGELNSNPKKFEFLKRPSLLFR